MSRSIVCGLTGGIACGKSTVARFLQDLGAVIIDADQISRDVVIPGSKGYTQLCEAFGPTILTQDKAIDRAKLGALIFSDSALRKTLESILHPLIAGESLRRIEAAKSTGVPLIVYEAALLVETNRSDDFRPLIVVWCSTDTQRKRIMARDQLNADAANQRLASQMPILHKVKYADISLENNHDEASLKHKVTQIWRELVDA